MKKLLLQQFLVLFLVLISYTTYAQMSVSIYQKDYTESYTVNEEYGGEDSYLSSSQIFLDPWSTNNATGKYYIQMWHKKRLAVGAGKQLISRVKITARRQFDPTAPEIVVETSKQMKTMFRSGWRDYVILYDINLDVHNSDYNEFDIEIRETNIYNNQEIVARKTVRLDWKPDLANAGIRGASASGENNDIWKNGNTALGVVGHEEQDALTFYDFGPTRRFISIQEVNDNNQSIGTEKMDWFAAPSHNNGTTGINNVIDLGTDENLQHIGMDDLFNTLDEPLILEKKYRIKVAIVYYGVWMSKIFYFKRLPNVAVWNDERRVVLQANPANFTHGKETEGSYIPSIINSSNFYMKKELKAIPDFYPGNYLMQIHPVLRFDIPALENSNRFFSIIEEDASGNFTGHEYMGWFGPRHRIFAPFYDKSVSFLVLAYELGLDLKPNKRYRIKLAHHRYGRWEERSILYTVDDLFFGDEYYISQFKNQSKLAKPTTLQEGNTQEINITLFPNPVSVGSQLNLHTTSALSNATYEISSLTGQHHTSGVINSTSFDSPHISLKELPIGMYIIRIFSAGDLVLSQRISIH